MLNGPPSLYRTKIWTQDTISQQACSLCYCQHLYHTRMQHKAQGRCWQEWLLWCAWPMFMAPAVGLVPPPQGSGDLEGLLRLLLIGANVAADMSARALSFREA